MSVRPGSQDSTARQRLQLYRVFTLLQPSWIYVKNFCRPSTRTLRTPSRGTPAATLPTNLSHARRQPSDLPLQRHFRGILQTTSGYLGCLHYRCNWVQILQHLHSHRLSQQTSTGCLQWNHSSAYTQLEGTPLHPWVGCKLLTQV
mgnify:CR=1 FL=1